MYQIYDKVVELMVSHLGLDPAEISPAATFSDLEMDSLSLVELSLILEGEYGINAEGINPKGTLAEAADYLEAAAAALGADDVAAGERSAS